MSFLRDFEATFTSAGVIPVKECESAVTQIAIQWPRIPARKEGSDDDMSRAAVRVHSDADREQVRLESRECFVRDFPSLRVLVQSALDHFPAPLLHVTDRERAGPSDKFRAVDRKTLFPPVSGP